MDLIGTNTDSSGLYRMYLDGADFVTHTSNGGGDFVELARQPLSPAPEYEADSDDDWYAYGTDGHQCDVHYSDPYARIDGAVYKLGPDQDPNATSAAATSPDINA